MIQGSPFTVFLGVVGLSVAGGAVAYYSGALDRFLTAPPAMVAALPDAARPAPSAPVANAPAPVAVPPSQAASAPQTPPEQKPQETVVAPVFDIVRAEADGSLVIAGKAAPGATVAIITGSKSLGEARASPEGDFAIVLDNPLKPGDYQIVLRATDPANVVAMSAQTAVVSIPDRKKGPVLALVEEPGQPSRLITTPDAPAATPPAASSPAASAPAAAQEPAAPAPAPASPPAAVVAKPEVKPAPAGSVTVKAVEIEGNKVFVAGTATPGSLVRVYANEILLGDARASPTGEFLVETIRDLAVGDYIIRADLLAQNGIDVLVRAQVPFTRSEGQSVAAVAPAVPAPAVSQPSQAAQGKAEALQPVDSAVIIRRGDTLWEISRRVYGRGVRYSTIYLANQQQISDPNRIWPGQVFSVPDTTDEGEKANLDAISGQTTVIDPAGPASAAEARPATKVQ